MCDILYTFELLDINNVQVYHVYRKLSVINCITTLMFYLIIQCIAIGQNDRGTQLFSYGGGGGGNKFREGILKFVLKTPIKI